MTKLHLRTKTSRNSVLDLGPNHDWTMTETWLNYFTKEEFTWTRTNTWPNPELNQYLGPQCGKTVHTELKTFSTITQCTLKLVNPCQFICRNSSLIRLHYHIFVFLCVWTRTSGLDIYKYEHIQYVCNRYLVAGSCGGQATSVSAAWHKASSVQMLSPQTLHQKIYCPASVALAPRCGPSRLWATRQGTGRRRKEAGDR